MSGRSYVRNISYSPATKDLLVAFTTAAYKYADVPFDVANVVCHAEPGVDRELSFETLIEGKYKSTRITP